MTKRRLTRRQAWRIRKVQEDRVARTLKKGDQAETQLDAGTLGPEQLRGAAYGGASISIADARTSSPLFSRIPPKYAIRSGRSGLAASHGRSS